MRYLLAVALILSACAKPEITGEVYVVTESRTTIKLSGSPVFLTPMDADTTKAIEDFNKNRNINATTGLHPTIMGTTDADGRFKIAAPAGRYAVSVMESRLIVADKREFYHWLVPVDSPGNITLNNANMQNLTP